MNIIRIKSFRDPVEVFDGADPKTLVIDREEYGLAKGFNPIDLVGEARNKYRKDATGALYRELYNNIDTRVTAHNKSSNRKQTIEGYIAIINKNGRSPEYLVFSLFEVSYGRFHAYIHSIYERETTEQPN